MIRRCDYYDVSLHVYLSWYIYRFSLFLLQISDFPQLHGFILISNYINGRTTSRYDSSLSAFNSVIIQWLQNMIVTNDLCTGNVHYYIYSLLLAHATMSASILTATVENERLLYPITMSHGLLTSCPSSSYEPWPNRDILRRLSNDPIPSSPGCTWTSSIVRIPLIRVSYPILSIRLQKVCEPW